MSSSCSWCNGDCWGYCQNNCENKCGGCGNSSCSGGCHGTNSCGGTSCANACGTNCDYTCGTCWQNCGIACSGVCSYTCEGGCYHGCVGKNTCGESCSQACGTNCDYTCDTCWGNCGVGCAISCALGCGNDCQQSVGQTSWANIQSGQDIAIYADEWNRIANGFETKTDLNENAINRVEKEQSISAEIYNSLYDAVNNLTILDDNDKKELEGLKAESGKTEITAKHFSAIGKIFNKYCADAEAYSINN